MNSYKINIKPTSQETILKFEVNKFITNHQSYEYNNIDEASDSPLAQQLFYLPFVKKVYIASNFIAIERFSIVDWKDVQDATAEQIENYLNSGAEIVKENTIKKVAVTVYAESTPNPAVLKFVSNKRLIDESYEFSSLDEAKLSPLATELFQFPFVKNVFLDENYISITKYDVSEWQDITLPLREFITQYIQDAKPIIDANAPKILKKTPEQLDEDFENYDETSKQIINILEEHIKPAVASDGGNIQFKSYDSNTKTVNVILQGACSGCPSSTFTLKNGIETLLKEMLSGKVETVVALNG